MSKARPLPSFPPLQEYQADGSLKTYGNGYALFYDPANDNYLLRIYTERRSYPTYYLSWDTNTDPWTVTGVSFTNMTYGYVLEDNTWVSSNVAGYTFPETLFCFSSMPIRSGGAILAAEGTSFDPNCVVVRGTELMPESWYPTLGTVLIPSDLIATLQGCSMLASILLPVVIGFLAFRKAYGFIKLTLGGA